MREFLINPLVFVSVATVLFFIFALVRFGRFPPALRADRVPEAVGYLLVGTFFLCMAAWGLYLDVVRP